MEAKDNIIKESETTSIVSDSNSSCDEIIITKKELDKYTVIPIDVTSSSTIISI